MLTVPEGVPTIANQAQWFVVWQGLGGDSKLAGRALNIDWRIIEALAHDFQWHAIAGGELGLKDEAVEKKINRITSYAQGKRLVKILENAFAAIESEPERLKKALFNHNADGEPTINAKPLVELAKALETAHNVCYRALGDKVAAEADSVGGPSDERVRNLSLTVINAVNNAAARTSGGKVVTEVVADTVGLS
jgi:hypothetical protein